MKIIGFSGSTRKNGNTSWAVEQILNGAKQTGAEATLFSSSDLDIKPCRGCYGCKNGDNGCVIKDDMQKVYAELKDADAVIFASPVYMGQMTGQAKVFMDRLFPTNSPRFSPYYKEQGKKKKMLLVFTQGNPDKTKFQTYFDYTKKLFEMLEYDVKDTVIIAGTRSAEAKDMDGLSESLTNIGLELGGKSL
jgi:multimeric flavodoxin WrbA